jgi:hypothetical protein
MKKKQILIYIMQEINNQSQRTLEDYKKTNKFML